MGNRSKRANHAFNSNRIIRRPKINIDKWRKLHLSRYPKSDAFLHQIEENLKLAGVSVKQILKRKGRMPRLTNKSGADNVQQKANH